MDALNGPFMKLIEGDPLARKALENLRTRQNMRSDTMDTLRQDLLPVLPYNAMPLELQRGGTNRALGFVPPYDFNWAWHDMNGHPPFIMIFDQSSGQVSLEARSGPSVGGAPGFVNASVGFGVFFRSDTTAQRFLHSVLNPGRFKFSVETSFGFGTNATSEGGFDLTVFEDGQFLVGASRKLWRRRIGSDEFSSEEQGQHLIFGPDLQFIMRAGHDYTFNAGIWVFSDYTSGIGVAAAQSILDGIVTSIGVSG
jgi:hypothetical protein